MRPSSIGREVTTYDCFMFYNEYEFDLLEMRMSILDEKVDKFLIVQANRTFSGAPKSYVTFEDTRFARFKNKIITANVDGTNWKEDIEPFEFWLRDRTKDALEQCGIKDSDLVILSDLDEIPNPATQLYSPMLDIPVTLPLKFYCYYINCQVFVKEGPPYRWSRTKKFRFGSLKSMDEATKHLPKEVLCPELGPIDGFSRLRHTDFPIEPSAWGWHFSSLGGADRIHQKYLTGGNQSVDMEYIREHMRTLKVFDDEDGRRMRFVEIDNSYPKYILDNIDRLGMFIGP